MMKEKGKKNREGKVERESHEGLPFNWGLQ
jgi:hypothetical protein